MKETNHFNLLLIFQLEGQLTSVYGDLSIFDQLTTTTTGETTPEGTTVPGSASLLINFNFYIILSVAILYFILN